MKNTTANRISSVTRWRLLAIGGVIALLVILYRQLPSLTAQDNPTTTPPASTLPAETPWQNTALGIETRVLHWKGEYGPVAVYAVHADAACDFRVVDRHDGVKNAGAMVADICPETGAAINAAYFDESMNPLGLLVVDGKQKQKFFTKGEWGFFMVRDGHPELVKSEGKLPVRVTQAVECKPRLLIGGTIPSFKTQAPAMRAAVGIRKDGSVVFAVTKGLVTLEQWAACLRDRLECDSALNLDGGPSAQLEAHGKAPLSVPGGWQVPIFITVTASK